MDGRMTSMGSSATDKTSWNKIGKVPAQWSINYGQTNETDNEQHHLFGTSPHQFLALSRPR